MCGKIREIVETSKAAYNEVKSFLNPKIEITIRCEEYPKNQIRD